MLRGEKKREGQRPLNCCFYEITDRSVAWWVLQAVILGKKTSSLPGDNDSNIFTLLLPNRVRSHVGIHFLLRVVTDGARVEHEHARFRTVLGTFNPETREKKKTSREQRGEHIRRHDTRNRQKCARCENPKMMRRGKIAQQQKTNSTLRYMINEE